MKKIAAFILLMLFPATNVLAADTYAYTGTDGVIPIRDRNSYNKAMIISEGGETHGSKSKRGGST